jgi:hypothetical protein
MLKFNYVPTVDYLGIQNISDKSIWWRDACMDEWTDGLMDKLKRRCTQIHTLTFYSWQSNRLPDKHSRKMQLLDTVECKHNMNPFRKVNLSFLHSTVQRQ